MNSGILPLLQAPGSEWRGQAEIFGEIFLVFLVLGTLVGIVVVTYTLYNAYKYRADSGKEPEDFDPPELGELPTGQQGGKGKKLFLSFGISAIIVISLVVYAYGLLLYVEDGPDVEGDAELEVDVVASSFQWDFIYENGQESTDTLYVPEDTVIRLDVTAPDDDVWHNFGVTELRIKADAIPGETAHTWFVAEETGTYHIECFELCGPGHSGMTGEVEVMEEEEFYDWYEGDNPNDQDQEAVSDHPTQEANA